MSLFVSLTPDMDDETLFAKVERGDVEAFTVVYNKYHKLLYVLAYRYLMDRNENNAIAKNYEIAQSIPEYEDTLIENLEKKEMMSLFYKAVDMLPPQKREICLMKVREELSNQEIADRLKLSINTIKTHYSEALKLLRAHLHKLLIFVTYLTLLKYLSVLFILWIIR